MKMMLAFFENRNRVRIIISLLVISLQLFNLGGFAQKLNKEYTTPSGLKYTITKKGKGEKPVPGDNVRVHYSGKFADGKIFDSSYKRGAPITFKLGKGQVIKGWDEGIAFLTVGGQAKFEIPPSLGYGDKPMGEISAGSTLYFDVELVEIVNPPIPFDVKGKDTLSLESGLKYIKINSTDGKPAEAFKTVSVDYTGFLLNGNIFDSSVERGIPFSFTLGKGQVIQGWEQGIAKLKVGEKARMIIPSNLGYGSRDMGSIPPNSTLIFDVELLEVK